jgi:sugar/nucleoside kinase (ribokinase family)
LRRLAAVTVGFVSPDGPRTISAERAAQNDATFRQANEEIRARADEWGLDGALPAICECADISCTALVRITPDAYAAVRAHPARFVIVPGHEANDQGWTKVVADFGQYVVVEKVGEAAEVAKRLDPRADV